MGITVSGRRVKDRNTTEGSGSRYVKAVHASGRYFVDQFGSPILVRGDSPWSAAGDLSTAEWASWCADRQARGFNCALVSLVGAVANGFPSDNGSNKEGDLPFTGGVITTPNEAFWAKWDTMIDTAAAYGITLFCYAIDGWNVIGGCVFGAASFADCQTYGAFLANRWASKPNIVWMFGGDFDDEPTQRQRMGNCLTGIRSTGDTRPASCQLLYQRSWTTQSTYWDAIPVDFQHVYCYPVQYDGVLAAYQAKAIPALSMEAFYAGMYDALDTNGGALTLRKQIGWSCTQGSPGTFYGTDDWEFKTGWASRLGTWHEDTVRAAWDIVASCAWWTLVPSRTFITSGAGTPIDASGATQAQDPSMWPSQSTYATAGVAADGSVALVYLPTQRAITINFAALAGGVTGTWLKASDPTTTSAAGALTGSLTPPSAGDWFLRISSTG